MDSILTTIKLLIGITEEDTSFDTQIITHINSVFFLLQQKGIGPDIPYKITGSTETWTDFDSDVELIEAVKEYIHLKVLLVFDTTLSSSVVSSINEQLKEYEWYLYSNANFASS